MNRYKNSSFLMLTLRFGLVFLIVISLIKIIIAIFNSGGFNEMIALYFGKETFLPFLKIQLAISVIYGLFMAGYYKFIKK